MVLHVHPPRLGLAQHDRVPSVVCDYPLDAHSNTNKTLASTHTASNTGKMSVPHNPKAARKTPPTALQLLEKSLGRDRGILNDISNMEVELEEQREFERFLGHKIRLGVFWKDSE